jgi:hypothetical protein
MNRSIFALVGISAVLALAGCASYDGRNLVAGVSTAADVAATMGVPADKLAAENGDTIWQYPHGPLGRETYAVRIGGDSKVKEVKQVLTEANVARIVVKQSTRDDVKAIIGRPYRVSNLPNLPREVWEYAMLQDTMKMLLFVQFTPDGKVAEVMMVVDPSTVSMGDSSN